MSPRELARRLPVTPGAGVFVLLLGVAFLVGASGVYPLYEYFGLNPAAVRRGEVWRVFTYPFLPAGPIDLIVGGWTVIWLGAWMERVWSSRECWLYGGICTVAAGVAACLLFPHYEGWLGGTAIPVVGLLVAWGRLCGHQRAEPAPGWQTSVRNVAWAWGGLLAIMAWFSCGRWFSLPMLAASAAAGGLYLSLRWRLLNRQAARPLEARRTSRLEL